MPIFFPLCRLRRVMPTANKHLARRVVLEAQPPLIAMLHSIGCGLVKAGKCKMVHAGPELGEHEHFYVRRVQKRGSGWEPITLRYARTPMIHASCGHHPYR